MTFIPCSGSSYRRHNQRGGAAHAPRAVGRTDAASLIRDHRAGEQTGESRHRAEGVHAPKAAETMLSLLNRYSSQESTDRRTGRTTSHGPIASFDGPRR